MQEFKRDEVTGEWGRIHHEELDELYSLPNDIWVIRSRGVRWARHVARVVERRGACRILVVKPEGKRPLKRPRHRCKNNIK
jgi:hypothetical protein